MQVSYTARARQVIEKAGQDAQRYFHPAVDTEHLLMALLQEPGLAGRALERLGVDRSQLYLRVKELMEPGPELENAPPPPLTPMAERVIQCAHQEAASSNREALGTEHLLLGILRVPEGWGAQLLRECKVDLGRALTEVSRLPPEDLIDSTVAQAPRTLTPAAVLVPVLILLGLSVFLGAWVLFKGEAKPGVVSLTFSKHAVVGIELNVTNATGIQKGTLTITRQSVGGKTPAADAEPRVIVVLEVPPDSAAREFKNPTIDCTVATDGGWRPFRQVSCTRTTKDKEVTLTFTRGITDHEAENLKEVRVTRVYERE